MLIPKSKVKKKRRARQGNHALERAAERYGIPFGKAQRREAVRQIQSGQAEYVGKGYTKRFSIWWVTIRETKMKVVYDKNCKSITTVLPEKDRENRTGRLFRLGQTPQ